MLHIGLKVDCNQLFERTRNGRSVPIWTGARRTGQTEITEITETTDILSDMTEKTGGYRSGNLIGNRTDH